MSHVQAACSRRDAQIAGLLPVHAELRTPTSPYMERSSWPLMPARLRVTLLWLVKVFHPRALALHRDPLRSAGRRIVLEECPISKWQQSLRFPLDKLDGNESWRWRLVGPALGCGLFHLLIIEQKTNNAL